MSFNLAELNRHVQGTVHGDSQYIIHHLKSLSTASSHDIAFVSGEKYLAEAKASNAGALIVPPELVSEFSGRPLIAAKSPYLAFARLTHVFATHITLDGIADTARIHPSAHIGQNVRIGHYVVIDAGSIIGDNSIIYPHVHIGEQVQVGHSAYIESHVTILSFTLIGHHARIHAGTSIGCEGFGFAPYQGQWHRIAQIGRVRLGDHVRIGSNCSIDRGALDDTVIDDGVIVDNLVQIAHNVQIGQHTAIAAKCAIAGSTKIGQHCIFGGGCGIAGHLEITDHVQLTGMSMVTKSILLPGVYSSGTSYLENSNWKRAVIGFRQLAETPISSLLKQIKQLKGRIEQLELSQTLSDAPDDDIKH